MSTLTTPLHDVGSDPAIAAFAAALLIALLVEREMASAAGGQAQQFARWLLVSIIPLLAVFTIIVSSRLLLFP